MSESLKELLAPSDRGVKQLRGIGMYDGVPNVAEVFCKVDHPIPNGFNSWTWMIPIGDDGDTIVDGPFVWGPDWWDYVESQSDC